MFVHHDRLHQVIWLWEELQVHVIDHTALLLFAAPYVPAMVQPAGSPVFPSLLRQDMVYLKLGENQRQAYLGVPPGQGITVQWQAGWQAELSPRQADRGCQVRELRGQVNLARDMLLSCRWAEVLRKAD